MYVLIVAIEYTAYAREGKIARLPGPHYDASCFKEHIQKRWSVPDANIVTLSDSPDSPDSRQPTHDNICKHIRIMVDNANKSKEPVWLYYSGHGSQLPALQPELELDGKDEVIVPSDFLKKNGFIRDDWLKHMIVDKLHPDCILYGFWDCCNSGTVMDLPVNQVGITPNHRPKERARGPLVVCISGCMDDQSSLSVFKNKKWQGAMTWALCGAMRATMNSKAHPFKLYKKLYRRLQRHGYKQRAQISSNVPLSQLDIEM